MKNIIVVGAVIKRKDGKNLCALRSESMSLSGFWEFPGGKVEEREDYKIALEREIQEELSCKIKVDEKITEVTYENVNLHTYWCEVIEGIPQPNEHEKIEWVEVEKLSTLNWAPADIPTVNIISKK